jgi:beta-galactosidase
VGSPEPRRRPGHSALPQEEPVRDEPAPTMLVVDGDRSLSYLLKRYAQRSGMRYLPVPVSGDVALDASGPTALWLPSIGSLEAVRPRETGLVGDEAPVIVCASADDEGRAQELGADISVAHPLTYPDFMAALRSVGIRASEQAQARRARSTNGGRRSERVSGPGATAARDGVVSDASATPAWPMLLGSTGLAYGADYNPDQWPEAVWRQDVRLMREARVNLVSVGIFSWARLEPEAGRFDFGWFDRVLDLLHEHGISADLATPTASPPPWLIAAHPEILPVTAEGARLRPGARRHVCPHAGAYREASARIARALAERYRNHPALAMWHVDNEYACHVGECFCDSSVVAFREWLARSYGSIAELNRAWATGFWGQIYGRWDEIQPPRPTPEGADPSPGQSLDWRRFWSDSWQMCFLEQKAILREVTPRLPVTTNFMGFHPPIDYWAFARAEDLVSNDAYPDTSEPEWMIDSAMTCDLIRSLGGGRPWLLMEQAIGHVNWRPRNATKRPGVMRMGSLQSVARGADGLMFFQWRASQSGAEMHHSAMIPHGGTDSRAWREAVALGAELAKVGEVRGSRVKGRAAIVFDWANWWALEDHGKPSADVRLIPAVRAIYAALFRSGITVDFVEASADLSGYPLVVAPTLYLVDEPSAANLRQYVAGGGTLLLSYFSGIVDRDVQIRMGGYPAPFREMLGLLVEEFAPFTERSVNRIRTEDGRSFEAATWADVVRTSGAETLATFQQDFYAGRPAVTRHRFGTGSAFYLATMPDEAGLAWTVARACAEAGLSGSPGAGAQVEIVHRTAGARTWVFVLNHSDQAVDVPLATPGVELLTGKRLTTHVHVPPVDVAVVRSGERPRARR